MNFDATYLNKTANKTARGSSPAATGNIEFVVWHGTDSPNPSNTPATLNWALINDGKRGAANYYIPQEGLAYWYIDPVRFIAHHAGAGGSHARGYSGFAVNVHAIGVEVEERISKKPKIPATKSSLAVAAELALSFKITYGIPLLRSYHVGHKEIVTPGYRSDPDSYQIDAILSQALALEVAASNPSHPPVDPIFLSAWSISGGVWHQDELTPGYAISSMFEYLGHKYQFFERGIARLESSGMVSWLLLSEIEAFKQATGR